MGQFARSTVSRSTATIMRIPARLVGFGIVTFTLMAQVTVPAEAQLGVNADPNFPYYPWCSVGPASQDREYRNCGFTSYAQCRESVRGQTGLCVENTWQTRPAAPPASARPSRKR